MLIDQSSCSVLVIDMQDRLLPAIAHAEALVSEAAGFLRVMQMLELPVVVTEHCTDKLGPTLQSLPLDTAQRIQKRSFAATATASVSHVAPGKQVLVIGCEAHVCVLQTVSALLAADRTVWLVDELIGSRHPRDRQLALSRMAQMGAHLVSIEMIYFECLRDAGHPHLRAVIESIRARGRASRSSDYRNFLAKADTYL